MRHEHREQLSVDGTPVTVVRSTARQRTVSLARVDGEYVLRAPATLIGDDLLRLARRLLERYSGRLRRDELNDDGALAQRAEELNRDLFGGALRVTAIRYVTNQRRCYGSCTPKHGTIRISDQVARLPAWVRDYVIVHELAHLVEANHGSRFWKLVNRYVLTERARGYLMALGLEEGVLGDDDGIMAGTGVV